MVSGGLQHNLLSAGLTSQSEWVAQILVQLITEDLQESVIVLAAWAPDANSGIFNKRPVPSVSS